MYGELPLIETTDGHQVPGYPVQILNPPKTAVLRLPTNDELMEYLRGQKSIYRDLGRRMGEGDDVPNPAADQKLFRAIRIDKDGPEFDDAEALRAIGLITRHRVTSCERDGQEYVVKLITPFGETVHTCRIPFERELQHYRANVIKARDLPHGMEERRFPPDVPAKLYDEVLVRTEGYLGGGNGSIPPHHKRAVITELVSSITALDPSLDPNF